MMERPDHNALRDAVTKACADSAYLHYQHPLWRRLADAFNWQDVWPVVNADGHLTGEVWTACDDVLHTADGDAMIRPEDAKSGGWEIDHEAGTAKQPTRRK